MTWGKRVTSEAEAQRFFEEAETYWKPLVVGDFNSDDVLARTPEDNRNGLTTEFEVAAVLSVPEAALAGRA